MAGDEVLPWPAVAVRAAASMVPVAGDALVMVVDQVIARQSTAGRQFLAEVAVGVDGVDVLADRLAESRRVQAMVIQAAQAAVETDYEAKRRLLSRVVTRAVLDDALVDTSQMIVTALRDLDAPHVRALERLWRTVQESRSALGADGQSRPHVVDTPEGWSERVREVFQAEPAPVRAALIRTGCIESSPVTVGKYEVEEWITDFGIELLADLHEHETD